MKEAFIVVSFSILLGACAHAEAYEPRDGDIIFHTSKSTQSLAIQKATKSPFSHMGIVYIEGDRAFVFEAIEPVKSTPLSEWTARGEAGSFVVKRLVNADRILTPHALQRMKEEGQRHIGKHYDLYFEWSDDRIYCSELVWKVFKRGAGVEIGTQELIASFDLSDPVVQSRIRERWNGPPPTNELVVSPAAIFASEELVTVHEE